MTDLDEIIKDLHTLNASRGIEFALMYKKQHAKAFEIESSEGINKKLLLSLDLKSELFRLGSKLDTFSIKPALKECYSLEISKKSTQPLLDQYYDLMNTLSQAVCKSIAKEWIKVAEPKKQALYPYKFFNSSKPPWWPAKVNHVEPDHLDKDSRINVLINILRNPSFELESLRVRTSVIGFKYPVTLRLLDEIYYLALYDRLLFGQGRESSSLAEVMGGLSDDDRAKILSGTIRIMVSDIRKVSNKVRHRGLVMARQIKESWLNDMVYRLDSRPLPKFNSKDTSSLRLKDSAQYYMSYHSSDIYMDEENKENIFQCDQKKHGQKRTQSSFINLNEEEKRSMKNKRTSAPLSNQIVPRNKPNPEGEFLDVYPEVDYSVVSQDVVNPLDTSLDRYSRSESSDDYYLVSSSFDGQQ